MQAHAIISCLILSPQYYYSMYEFDPRTFAPGMMNWLGG